MNNSVNGSKRPASRRSFIKKGLTVAGTATAGAALLAKNREEDSGRLNNGDAAILRFLAAAEIIESDLWIRYNELGGVQDREVPGGKGSAAYTAALKNLMGIWTSTSTTTLRMKSLIPVHQRIPDGCRRHHPSDRQHGAISFRDYRTGRHQPLPVAGPAGH